jgi:hypothetical protein
VTGPVERDGIGAAVLLGKVVEAALLESAEVDQIAGANGNGTWFEVAMSDGTLVQVTIEASRD